MDNKQFSEKDKLTRQPVVNSNDRADALSPMDPPEAYEPPSKVAIEYDQMHPYLQNLMDEHVELKSKMLEFEKLLVKIRGAKSLSLSDGKEIANFFAYFDIEFIEHNRKEEAKFFPLLANKLIESGEHSSGPVITTGVDVLIDEHLSAVRMAAACTTIFEMITQVRDVENKKTILFAATKKGLELIELVRLHIFREDEIIFGLGQELLTNDELSELYT